VSTPEPWAWAKPSEVRHDPTASLEAITCPSSREGVAGAQAAASGHHSARRLHEDGDGEAVSARHSAVPGARQKACVQRLALVRASVRSFCSTMVCRHGVWCQTLWSRRGSHERNRPNGLVTKWAIAREPCGNPPSLSKLRKLDSCIRLSWAEAAELTSPAATRCFSSLSSPSASGGSTRVQHARQH